MATGKRTSAAVKARAVADFNGEHKPLELAKKYKVRYATIAKWDRQAREAQTGGKPTKAQGRVADTSRDILVFLEHAEKAIIEDLTTRKRKRMTRAESYTMLALTTLRGG